MKAYTTDFEDNLDDPGEPQRTVVRVAGRAGLASRGVVFVMIGAFMGYAALSQDSSQARGLEGALETLGQQPCRKIETAAA